MAMTTSSSIRVKPRERDEREEYASHGISPFCRCRAKSMDTSTLSQRHWSEQTDCEHACRMLEAEASKQNSAGRSSGLRLKRPWTTFPQAVLERTPTVALLWSRSLADYSSGPATDLHRFPFSSPAFRWKAGNLSRSTKNVYEVCLGCPVGTDGMMNRRFTLVNTVGIRHARRSARTRGQGQTCPGRGVFSVSRVDF